MVVWLSIFIFLCVISCCLLCCCSVAVDRSLQPPRNQDQNHNGNYNHITVLGQPSAAQSGAVSPPYYENEPTQKEEEERIVFALLKSRLKLEVCFPILLSIIDYFSINLLINTNKLSSCVSSLYQTIHHYQDNT